MKVQFAAFGMALALMLGTSGADAACQCRCVNGQVTALCNSTLEIPPICAPQICPIVPPSIQPIPKPDLPPLGTTSCTQAQVFNPSTGRYEWQRVCK